MTRLSAGFGRIYSRSFGSPLMANDPSVPSSTPEDLVHQITCGNLIRQEVDAAWRQLLPVIERVAGRAARALHADQRLRDELVGASVGHLHDRIDRYDADQGPFEVWLQHVLYNLGSDIRRRLRRWHSLASDPEAARPARSETDPNETVAEQARRFEHLRYGLDRCAWEPRRKVDHYAVLLLQLRLVIGARYHAGRGGPMLAPRECADWVAQALPWHAAEQARHVIPPWPHLAEIWQALAPWLDAVRPLIDLVARLNDTLDASHRVPYGTFLQWTYRARMTARRRLRAEDWCEYGFARLLDTAPSEGR